MKIIQLHALRVRLPQKAPIAPYQSRYRATSFKEALLIRLATDNGLVGWGETPDDSCIRCVPTAVSSQWRRTYETVI